MGLNYSGQCSVGGWTDIIGVAAGDWHTVGLSSDGTVVAVGWNQAGKYDGDEWTDIIQIAAGCSCTVGLKFDGTVVVTSAPYCDDPSLQCDIGSWDLF